MSVARLLTVLQDVRACRLCVDHLPLGPRPLLAAHQASRIVLISQAPGRAAHESGVPWNDRSGDRLRAWLGISRDQFYDRTAVAIIPMGFCFPGTGRQGGHRSPCRVCPSMAWKIFSTVAVVGTHHLSWALCVRRASRVPVQESD